MTDKNQVLRVSPAAKKATPNKKTSKEGTAKASRPAATHPKTSVMVTAAIKKLNEKKGSTLHAIKKYIGSNYQVDPVKHAPFIRKCIKKAVIDKKFVRVKGAGAHGHFKLAEAKPKIKMVVAKKKKSSVVKKTETVPSTPKTKKSVSKKVKSTAGEPAIKKAKISVTPKIVKPKTPIKQKTKPPVKPKLKITKKPIALRPKSTKSPKKTTVNKAIKKK